MNLTNLVRKLEKQLKGTEKQAQYYDAQARTLRDQLEAVARAIGERVTGAVEALGRPKGSGGMSEAGKRTVALAQKKRWDAWRKKNGKKVKVSGKGRGKGLSAAGRARIRKAQLLRWAKARKQGK
jgi:hypothetical protein